MDVVECDGGDGVCDVGCGGGDFVDGGDVEVGCVVGVCGDEDGDGVFFDVIGI